MAKDKDAEIVDDCKNGSIFSDVFNITTAAQYLGLSRAYLYKLVELGEVPYCKVGSRILFRRCDLHEWVGRFLVQPKQEALTGGIK